MKLSDFETYRSNPTIPVGVVTRDIRDEGDIMETITADGEAMFVRKLGSAKTVRNDTLPYKKVYNDAFPTIKDFSSCGLKVWCFIVASLKPREDEVFIEIEDCKLYTGYTSDMAIYRGIIELLDKKFLFRKTGSNSSFFINVNMFFNGKRI